MNGPKHGTVPHSLTDPEFITDFTVQAKHHHQRQEEENYKDKGGVDFLVYRAGPLFQAADVFFFI